MTQPNILTAQQADNLVAHASGEVRDLLLSLANTGNPQLEANFLMDAIADPTVREELLRIGLLNPGSMYPAKAATSVVRSPSYPVLLDAANRHHAKRSAVFEDESLDATTARVLATLHAVYDANSIFANDTNDVGILLKFVADRSNQASLQRTMSAQARAVLIVALTTAVTGFMLETGRVGLMSGTYDKAAGLFVSILLAPPTS